LRSTQHFDALDVENREALQDYVLLHHFIHDDRHGLRGGKIEVVIAEAAHVETRCQPAVRRFGIQAGNPVGDGANVFATFKQAREALAEKLMSQAEREAKFEGAQLDNQLKRAQIAKARAAAAGTFSPSPFESGTARTSAVR